MLFLIIVAIILAVMMLGYAISLSAKKEHLHSIIFYILTVLYILLCIYSFYTESEYSNYIITGSLIVLCILSLIAFGVNPNNKMK